MGAFFFRGIPVLIFTVAVSASLCLAQTKAVDKRGETLFEGRPFFTDSALYNSYDLGGSPLGLFDKGTPRFGASLGYRHGGLGGVTGHYWDAPALTMGNPGMSFFQVFYAPRKLSYGNGGYAVSLPLQRFGFAGATQGTSGAFRASFLFEGFYGKQEWRDRDSARVIMGAEKLRFDFGSQVHPLARIGFYIGTKGTLDTLNAPWRRDASAYINLPEFGVNLDVGGEDLPVRGNIDFAYAWSRFVYTAWAQNGLPGVSTPGLGLPAYDGGDASAIRNDSLSVFWSTLGRFPFDEDKFTLRPGLFLGFTNNAGEMREPHPGDNSIIELGGVRKGSEYELTGFWFGLGAGFGAMEYVDAHVEYTLAALSLDYGSLYSGAAGETSRTLHSVAVGASTPINKYVEMPVAVTPRVAWFTAGAANAASAISSRLGLGQLNTGPAISKLPLYLPQDFLRGFTRVSGFTVGVDGQALEGSFEASLWATFLSSKPKGGTEIGARLGFLLN